MKISLTTSKRISAKITLTTSKRINVTMVRGGCGGPNIVGILVGTRGRCEILAPRERWKNVPGDGG